jgi:hypothetical protein
MNRKVLILIAAAAAVAIAALIPLTTASGRTGHQSRAVAAADAATVRTAKCADWRIMDAGHRKAVVEGMYEFFTARLDIPSEHAYGTGLTDAKAVKLFDGYCKPSFAGNFRLYRLYGDAATFTPTEQ